MRRNRWKTCLAAAILVGPLMYCADESATAPAPAASRHSAVPPAPGTVTPALVRQLAAARGIVPLPRAPYVRPALARLGQALAFDKIMSGNRDISCTTCHLPEFATGDGRSLSIGQGGTGIGPGRRMPSGIFIPRNAPPHPGRTWRRGLTSSTRATPTTFDDGCEGTADRRLVRIGALLGESCPPSNPCRSV